MCSLNETRWPRQCMILDWVLEQKMNSSEKTGKIQLRSAMNSFVWILFVSSCCAQLCQALYDPMDCSLPGSSVPGILQARILEWVANPFSRGSFWPRDWTQVSCIAGRLHHLPSEPLGKTVCGHTMEYYIVVKTTMATYINMDECEKT